MKEFKGTLGPWSYVADAINNIAIIDESEGDICYIEAMNDDYLLSEVEWSNARLIAAAPELLECLNQFVKGYYIGLTKEELNTLRINSESVINKALGE